jgi:two-component system sensor histidine kinase KdpD
VRYAKRLADRLHGPWTALYVEGRRSIQLSEEERDRIADTLRLAEALGGEAVTLPADDRSIADDVIGYAHEHNVTQIIIGKSTRSRWFEILHGSVVHELVRRSGNISVHVIAGDQSPAADPEKDRAHLGSKRDVPIRDPICSRLWRSRSRWASGNWSMNGSAVENVDLVFLTAVVAVAVRFGLWPSLLASLASALCYNFFFLPPIYTFTIADPTNIAAFVLFTIVAVIVSNVAARGRTAGGAAHGRACAPSRFIPSAASSPAPARSTTCLWATAYQTALMLKVRVVLLLPSNGSIAVRPAIRRRIFSTTPISPRRNGPGRTIAPPAAAPIRCRAPSVCSCRCIPGAAPSASSASTATSRPAAHARSAAAARRAARSGRARHRARAAGRGDGSRRAHRRNRTAALGAADLDLA